MLSRNARATGLVFSVLLTNSVTAADAPEAWLERMTLAGQSLNYSGTFVYRRDDQMVAVNILHVADDRGGREQLVALNGSGNEIVRSCDGAVCLLPRRKSVVVSKLRGRHNPGGDVTERIGELRNYYRFALVGEDRVAGRPAQALIIEPGDHYRYGYRLWIDRETGLLLKSDTVAGDGSIVEQIMFTDLEVIDTPTGDMLAAVDQKRLAGTAALSGDDVIYSDEDENRAERSWRVENVPGGFRPVEHFRHRRSTASEPTEHMIFTDGLASVSVFIEKGNGDTLSSGFSTMGAINVFGVTVGSHQVTVVGEVPTLTVQLIGESVRQIAASNGE